MSELSEQEKAANALGVVLLDADQNLRDKFTRIYNELSKHTASGGFVPLLEPVVSGPSHPFYLEAVVGDARILRALKETLPQFLRNEDIVPIYVGVLISHMRTLEGQEEAIRLHRDLVKEDEDASARFALVFKGIENEISTHKNAWTQKFGINPNIHDVEAAVRAAAAGPKIEDQPPPGPDFC